MEALRRKEISKRLSYTLDCLGYSQEMVSLRREFYKMLNNLEHMTSPSRFLGTSVIVGSRGEGIVKFYESDMDTLMQTKGCVCVDSEYSCRDFPDKLTPIIIPCVYHPGHCRLFVPLYKQNNLQALAGTSLYGVALSHSWMFNYFDTNTLGQRSGPAFCANLKLFDHDGVMALPCTCRSILNRWLYRPRKHNWPLYELRYRISQMSGNIVANGLKGCDDEEYEWRLCFNEIELLLVNSWNDTQTKVYKMLKMVKTDIIKPKQKEITSFILKNVVLWLAEMNPQNSFRHNNLFDWVLKALRLLKRAIKLNYLPYYMIPERNLLVERVDKSQRKGLIKQIRNILNCGPFLLADCEKIKFSMKMCPTELSVYNTKLHDIEKAWMSFCLHKKGRNVSKSQIDAMAAYLCLPWPHPVQQDLDKCSSSGEMLRYLLS